MLRTARRPISCALALALVCGVAHAQAPKKADPEVGKMVTRLTKAVAKPSEANDAAAITVMVELAERWRNGLHKTNQKKASRAVGATLTRGRVRKPTDVAVYRAAIDALGVMGAAGAQQLKAAYKSKRFPARDGYEQLRAQLITALGATGDKTAAEFLLDCAARATSPSEQAAAGGALAGYADAKQALRKEIVKKLVSELAAAEGQAVMGRAGDPVNLSADMAQKRVAAISEPWRKTLHTIAGVDLPNGTEWQRWWNDHKKANWDAPSWRKKRQ